VKPLHLIGAGGHARVVFDVVRSISPERIVEWHDDEWQRISLREPVDAVSSLDALWSASLPVECFVAVGNADSRLTLLERLVRHGHSAATLVHRNATVSPNATCAHGCVVMAGAVVQTSAVLEVGVIVNTAASVDHDCRIGEGVHIAPGAHLAGDVCVGARTWIGVGAVVREGTRIGAGVTVGAGAVVVKDIPDGLTVVGNPARVAGTQRRD
jgi:sugar O-acyltransferase (sialic acid O-acetyltransferase NeuD family)